MKKAWFKFFLWGVLVALVLYLALVGAVLYKTSVLNDFCATKYPRAENTPQRFYLHHKKHTIDLDLSRWWIKRPTTTVQIQSATPGVRLNATLVPQENAKRWVIVVHGIETCQKDAEVLTVAGMLSRGGFSVMMVDLREHGASTRTWGWHSGGYYESQDVLSAWKWLQKEKGVRQEDIGVYGISFGAGSTAIAFGLEKRLQVVWLDSPYASMPEIIETELQRLGLPFPRHLVGFVQHVWKWFRGIDLQMLSSLEGMRHIGNRSVVVSYNLNDQRTPAHHGQTLCKVAQENAKNILNVHCYPHTGGVKLPYADKVNHHVVGQFTDKRWAEKVVVFFKTHLGHPLS